MKEVFVLMQEQLTMNRPKGHHLTLKERGNISLIYMATTPKMKVTAQ
ncbi:hypothetical protein [Levilactobacillus yonginensis]|nr:hypothetical protein [Levilactobacillus yonginensis]